MALNPLIPDVIDDALKAFMRALDADAAWYLGIATPDVQGPRYAVDVTVLGPAPLRQSLLAVESTDLRVWPMSLGDLASLNRMGIRPAEVVPRTIREGFWDPYGLHSSLSANISHAGRLLGTVDVLRGTPHAPFHASDVRRANKLLPELRAVLVELTAARDATPASPARWLLTSEGEVLYAADVADVHAHLGAALAATVKRMPRDSHVRHLGRHRLTYTPVTGARDACWLVQAEPMFAVPIPEALNLSPIKRRIADLAVHGATAQEIGDHLGRSPETVRAHLREIYRRLGVANRVELSGVLSSDWAI